MAPKRQSLAGKLSRTTGLQLVLVAGSLSIFSFSLGRQGAIEQRETFKARIPVIRVSEQLSKKLSYPTIINELNEAAIAADPQLLNDFDRLSHRFWRQLNSFPVDYINFGGTNGIFLGLEKTETGEIYHNEDSARFGRGIMHVYSMTNDGHRLAKHDAIPGMSDSHEEAWYVDTIKAGKATWSSIYAWEDQPQTFSISYNAPIFDNNNKLLGVVGVDMIINQLSAWLQTAWKNDQGLALIMEANGNLVASSAPDITFTTTGKTVKRTNIRDVKNKLAEQIHDLYFENDNILTLGNTIKKQTNKSNTFSADGENYLTKITSWGDEYGLNWYLVTAIRADKEWGAAQRNIIIFFSISITSILLTLLINRRLIRGLLNPLSALTKASLNTKEQTKHDDITTDTSEPLAYTCQLGSSTTQEVFDLNQAIKSMVEAFNRLTQTIRKKDEQALAAMSNKLKVSLETASISHEINQPLSIVRLASQNLFHALTKDGGQTISPALNEWIKTLNKETERITKITEKMRALLRNAQTHIEAVDLRQVIESSIQYVESNNKSASCIDCTGLRTVSEGEAMIQGDAVQLQLAIINLIKNSLEALEDQKEVSNQSIAHLVRVSLQKKDQTWEINVEDNGPGINENMLSEMPLMSSKPEGTGLGLFIVQSAAEGHGGRLTLSRSSLGGLKACISLPKHHLR
jgi:C4-dicarboxylate-specific signal transduction histidine kinase